MLTTIRTKTAAYDKRASKRRPACRQSLRIKTRPAMIESANARISSKKHTHCKERTSLYAQIITQLSILQFISINLKCHSNRSLDRLYYLFSLFLRIGEICAYTNLPSLSTTIHSITSEPPPWQFGPIAIASPNANESSFALNS